MGYSFVKRGRVSTQAPFFISTPGTSVYIYIMNDYEEFIKQEYTEKDVFDIANDVNFYSACMDVYDAKPHMQRNMLQTVGDRMRLVKKLQEYGFKIVKIK